MAVTSDTLAMPFGCTVERVRLGVICALVPPRLSSTSSSPATAAVARRCRPECGILQLARAPTQLRRALAPGAHAPLQGPRGSSPAAVLAVKHARLRKAGSWMRVRAAASTRGVLQAPLPPGAPPAQAPAHALAENTVCFPVLWFSHSFLQVTLPRRPLRVPQHVDRLR